MDSERIRSVMMTTGNPLSVAMMTITFFVDIYINIDTRLYTLREVLFAFTSPLSTSLSIFASDVIMHPK